MCRNGRGKKPIWGCWVQSFTSLGRYYDHRPLQLFRLSFTRKKIDPLISRRHLGRNRRNVNHKSANLSTTLQARRKEGSIALFSAVPYSPLILAYPSIVCRGETIVWRQQTMVWWEQTIVWCHQTKPVLAADTQHRIHSIDFVDEKTTNFLLPTIKNQPCDSHEKP